MTELEYRLARIRVERQILDHIEGLETCIRAEMTEPLRSTLLEVCRILTGVCAPTIEAAALANLYAMEAEKVAQLGEN